MAIVREKNPDRIATHCLLHRELLVAKTVPDDLKKVPDTSAKMVNFIKSRPLNSRLFEMLCKEAGAEHKTLLLHTEVCWLSRGKILRRIYELREEVVKFISANKSKIKSRVKDEMCWIKLTYLTEILVT